MITFRLLSLIPAIADGAFHTQSMTFLTSPYFIMAFLSLHYLSDPCSFFYDYSCRVVFHFYGYKIFLPIVLHRVFAIVVINYFYSLSRLFYLYHCNSRCRHKFHFKQTFLFYSKFFQNKLYHIARTRSLWHWIEIYFEGIVLRQHFVRSFFSFTRSTFDLKALCCSFDVPTWNAGYYFIVYVFTIRVRFVVYC